ncbi:GFA family protein [Bradyrhizobium sp. USDA 4461]
MGRPIGRSGQGYPGWRSSRRAVERRAIIARWVSSAMKGRSTDRYNAPSLRSSCASYIAPARHFLSAGKACGLAGERASGESMKRPFRTGGCNCGAVRYTAFGEPLTCFICHCRRCQRRTGSAFGMFLVYPTANVRISCGSPEKTTRVTPQAGRNTTTECPVCRSKLWVQRNGSKAVNLRAGTLDYVGDLRPVAQCWTSSAQLWALSSGILSFDEEPSNYLVLFEAWKRAFPPDRESKREEATRST